MRLSLLTLLPLALAAPAALVERDSNPIAAPAVRPLEARVVRPLPYRREESEAAPEARAVRPLPYRR